MPAGTCKLVRDAVANDSDKTFTVPTGKVWCLHNVMAQLSCTATAGDRYLLLVITDGTNALWTSYLGAASSANEVGMYWWGSPIAGSTVRRNFSLAANVNDEIDQPILKDVPIPSGYTIRVYDVAAVDVAADDLIVILHYTEYDA